jgi:electron transport complex protein RnfE
MLLKAYVPAIDKALGIFIPLIVVNCIILARAEAFASKNTVITSVVDGIGMGIGFTAALLVMGSVREILGNGSLFGFKLFGDAISPALAMILPPGGFLAFGLLIGLVNRFSSVKISASGCMGCGGQCKKMLAEEKLPLQA